MSVIDALLQLQDTDIKIRAMEKELSDIPARKDLEQRRLLEHSHETSEKSQALRTLQAELKKVELDVESCREKINKLRQQQMSLKTNKEFRAIETEVEAVEREITGHEDRELLIMDQIESARRDLAEKEKALGTEQSAVKQDIEVWDRRAEEIEKRVAEERVIRESLAEAVDPVWRIPYERILARKDRALVAVEDGVCGGCHMQLPPFLVHDARARQKIVMCGFCGRMLYS